MLTYSWHGEQPKFVTSMIGKITTEAQRSTNAAFACAWGKFSSSGRLVGARRVPDLVGRAARANSSISVINFPAPAELGSPYITDCSGILDHLRSD
jgi:hypothetical protein